MSVPAPLLTASPADPINAQLDGLSGRVAQLSSELETLRRSDALVLGRMHKLDEEQRLAARLQQDFLPKRLPQAARVTFHTLYRPAAYVSGDLYDVMRLDEAHVGFYVADAVGHGMPAALLTMFMKNALVTKEVGQGSYRLLEPRQTISRLNQSLCAQGLSHATFATAAYGTVNTQTLEMSFSTAGHPSPVLVRDGALHDLKNDGALLGIFPDEAFHDCRVQLAPGDRVFCFTDGIEVPFAANDPKRTDQWRDALLARQSMSVGDVLQSFSAQLDSIDESVLPKDDLTIVAFEIR